jgi:hypothetical protein
VVLFSFNFFKRGGCVSDVRIVGDFLTPSLSNSLVIKRRLVPALAGVSAPFDRSPAYLWLLLGSKCVIKLVQTEDMCGVFCILDELTRALLTDAS